MIGRTCSINTISYDVEVLTVSCQIVYIVFELNVSTIS